jgi:hypothetical protein
LPSTQIAKHWSERRSGQLKGKQSGGANRVASDRGFLGSRLFPAPLFFFSFLLFSSLFFLFLFLFCVGFFFLCPGFAGSGLLGFDDLAAPETAGADANAFPHTLYFGVNWTQIDIPAPLAHVMSVADVISELRPFAADFTYL